MSGRETVEVNVFRFDPAVDPKPYIDSHVVPHIEGATVLDALQYIYENFDSTLTMRWNCRSGQCGLCAVRVDDRPTLACTTRTVKNSKVTVKPLETLKVQKDLAVDFTPVVQRLQRVEPYLKRASSPSKPGKIADEDRQVSRKAVECIECWVCHDVCPASRSDPEGFAGPAIMTKLAKLRFHEADVAPRDATAVEEGLYRCMLCMDCATVCPEEIDIPTIALVPLRAAAFEGGYGPPPELKRVLETLTLEGRAVPRGDASFLERAPEVVEVEDAADEVALFTGCIIDRALPQVGFAVLEVLRKNKTRVHIPKGQTCSGYPALAAGDRKLLRDQLFKNLAALEALPVNKVVTACPECAYMLRVHLADVLQRTSNRGPNFEVYELTEYLADLQHRDRFSLEMNRVKASAAYHDACVLNRVFHISEEPRKLLAAVPYLKVTEMTGATVCSGAGGGLMWTQPLAAEALGRGKIQAALEARADTLAVSCPFCILHLRKYAEGRKPSLKVNHIAELLAEAYSQKR